MKKRVLSALVSMTLLLGLLPSISAPTLAASTGSTVTRTTSLYVNEMETSSNSSEGWSWNKETKTLTLENANIVASDRQFAINVDSGTTTIVLHGDNNVICAFSDTTKNYVTAGISSQYGGNIIFEGDGTLTVSGGGKGIYSYYYGGSVTVNGGTIVAAGETSNGVLTTTVTINGGSLTAIGGSSPSSVAINVGLHIDGELAVNGGELTAVGGTSGRSDPYATAALLAGSLAEGTTVTDPASWSLVGGFGLTNMFGSEYKSIMSSGVYAHNVTIRNIHDVSAEVISAPVISIDTSTLYVDTDESATVSWEPVEGAYRYTLSLSNTTTGISKDYFIYDCSRVLKDLTAGNYEIVVFAEGTSGDISAASNMVTLDVVNATTETSEIAQNFVDYAVQFDGKTRSYFKNTFGVGFASAWCADFLTWCAEQVGLSSVIPRTPSVGTLYETITNPNGSYKASGVYFADSYSRDIGNKIFQYANEIDRENYTPQTGDLIFIVWAENTYIMGHVGIVIDYNEETSQVYFVDGNAGNGIVKVRDGETHDGYSDSYGLAASDKRIVGYVRPNYSAVSMSGTISYSWHCPIEVTVSCNQETLSSADEQWNASFGSMCRNGDGSITADLNYGLAYSIEVEGTDTGTMDLDVSYNLDSRSSKASFEDVAITEGTRISVVSNIDNTSLIIYRNEELYEVWMANNGDTATSADDDLLTALLAQSADAEDEYEPSDQQDGSSIATPSTHTVAISAVTNGSISVSPAEACEGDTVTITVTPDRYYTLASLVVTDSKGREITVKDNGDGAYTFTMPASKVMIEATFELDEDYLLFLDILAGAAASQHDCLSAGYTDLDASLWYHEAVDYVLETGLMTGYSSTTFAPGDTMTRAMLAQILYNQAGRPAVTGTSGFTDVAADAWYADAVIWASAQGCMQGYGDGTFGAADAVTREQLAAVLYRQAGSPAASGSLDGFADGAQVSAWARPALLWATSNGVVNGSGGSLNPCGGATRAEVAQMLFNHSKLS